MRFGQMPDIDDAGRYSGKDYFSYQVGLATNTTLAPAGTTTLTFNIAGESDFFWTSAQIAANTANDGTSWSADLKPAVYVTITDNYTSQPLMNNPVPVGSIFGNGQLPFILPIRKVFFAKATVKLQLSNYSDNQTFTQLEFTFTGIKAYLKSQ